MSDNIQAELFEQAVRGFFFERLRSIHTNDDLDPDEWTDAIVAIAADHPPTPCPYVVTRGATSHCALAEAEADHFYDEAFHNDPYLLGRVRAEVDRMRSVAL